MSRLFKLILSVSVLFTLVNSVKAQSVTKKDYYDFYNSILISDSTDNNVLIKQADYYDLKSLLFLDTNNFSARLDYQFGKEHMDSIFSKDDIEAMRKQLLKDSIFKWSERKLKRKFKIIDVATLINTLHINSDSGWNSFHNKYGAGFSTFSIPLFSKDKSFCIIYQSELCGRACGSGYLFVYKRRNGKWVLYRGYNMWIS